MRSDIAKVRQTVENLRQTLLAPDPRATPPDEAQANGAARESLGRAASEHAGSERVAPERAAAEVDAFPGHPAPSGALPLERSLPELEAAVETLRGLHASLTGAAIPESAPHEIPALSGQPSLPVVHGTPSGPLSELDRIEMRADLLALQAELARANKLNQTAADFWRGWAGLLGLWVPGMALPGLEPGYTAGGEEADVPASAARKVSLKG